eukprot:TRINITY_DN4230_c0_g5_i1.p1 TRINITY_DN4230_c0_g5~~TRINITY_DN4230_c0_g5_i1.p1  ORF type:complete len:636 (-),score=216.65 TRINITY_DN4230_c0_g5_i1:175-1833(-)
MDDPVRAAFDKLKRVRRPDVRLSDFAGLEGVKEEINEIINFLRDPKRYSELGARPPRGVLISGESGTGKTTLARAIAAEARVPVVEVNGPELEGGAWVGQGAANVRELFKTAREMAPLIIFMEDFDEFGSVRGASLDAMKQDHESMLNQLLVELDGFETQEGVVLLATTTRPWNVDPALRRPGRMDRLIALPTPNAQEREGMLLAAAKRFMSPHLVSAVDWRYVAEQTVGMRASDLREVPTAIESAAAALKPSDDDELTDVLNCVEVYRTLIPQFVRQTAWAKGMEARFVDWLGLTVTPDDVSIAVSRIDFTLLCKPAIELYIPSHPWDREYKYPHAVWAVGKALLAELLPNFAQVYNVWLTPSSWEGIAFTRIKELQEGSGFAELGARGRASLEKKLVSLFGSHAAAVMLLPWGQSNTLATPQLQKAQKLAASMVLELGWSSDGVPMVYHFQGGRLPLGERQEEELQETVEQLYLIAKERAFSILSRNKAALEASVELLLRDDFIDAEDIRRILTETRAAKAEEPWQLLPYTPPEPQLTGTTSREALLSPS